MPSADQIRQNITNKIIVALRTGELPPWRQPWSSDPNCGAPKSALTKRPFRGINVLLLTMASMEHGFQSCWWGTYRQINQLGGRVRRGERSTAVVLYDPFIKPTTIEEGDGEKCKHWFVFNVEQTVGPRHGVGPLIDGHLRRVTDRQRCVATEVALHVAASVDERDEVIRSPAGGQ